MQPSKIDLAATIRTPIIALLQARLADAIDLALQAKQAHWNVKGPQFIALHELFDAIRTRTDVYVDDLAERIVQLGGVAEGTLQAVGARTQLAPYSVKLVQGREHLEALVAAHSRIGKAVRADIDEAARLGDADTADLLTGISRGLDKDLWFLEAHLSG